MSEPDFMGEEEGVIKYRLDYREADPLHYHDFSHLTHWHRRFKEANILGQDDARYDGYGFGNISQRLSPASFIISGTQTGHLDVLPPEAFAVVRAVDIASNAVEAEGPVKPSSEALSHAAIYALSKDIKFVFHVHSPALWNARQKLALPETRASVPYGTPQMASEIKRLFDETTLPQTRVLAMAGHEDGIISFGASSDEAGKAIMNLFSRDLTP